MKKIYLSLLLAAFFTTAAFAQNVSFNYQAVARDQNDQPYKGTDDEPLQITISILDGTNTEVYAEDHEDIRTSSLGIFNLRIGEGTNKNGDLADIDWSADGPFDLEVTIRAGAASAKKLPRSRLVFVPFAIYATKAGELEGNLGGDVNGKYTNVQLNSSVVGTQELADNAVTTAKMANGAVENAKIGPDAVTTEKIAPLAVKTDDLDNGAVNDSKLAVNAVTNSKIANGAVDNTKLANMGATDGKVLKWTAGAWSPQDDGGAGLVGGAGININGNTVSAVDNSASNEIQVISWDGPNSTLGLTNGGGAVILNAPGVNGDIVGNMNDLQIKQNAVTSFEIADGSVTNLDIGTGQITGDKFAPYLSLNVDSIRVSGGPLIVDGMYSTLSLYYGPLSILSNSTYSHNHLYTGLPTTNAELPVAHIPLPNLFLPALPSIKASGTILGKDFYAISDFRTKSKITSSNPKEDLSILMQIKPRDFLFKDILKSRGLFQKGFIAQEVEQVFPEAVSRTTDFIPDIYQIARRVQYNPVQRSLSLTVDSLTKGLKVGDKIRIIADQQREVLVSAVDGTTITVADWPVADTKEAFVFGKQVNDFRVVDYDRIFTLNVSATQALIAEVDELKAQVAALQAKNNCLSEQNAGLEKGLQNLESRVNLLVSRLDAPVGPGGTERK